VSAAPKAALSQGGSVWDAVDANIINQQILELSGQGRYSEALPLAQKAIALLEKALGPDNTNVAQSLNSLAMVYIALGRYLDAEPLCKRSVEILEKGFGPDHVNVVPSLITLAILYEKQGRYADVEPLFKRSLAINEKVRGPDHHDVALKILRPRLCNRSATVRIGLRGSFAGSADPRDHSGIARRWTAIFRNGPEDCAICSPSCPANAKNAQACHRHVDCA
jgi:tetratricopeptide (TPR) repeat protein